MHIIKNKFVKFLSSSDWLLPEEKWSTSALGRIESAFTLGNGYLGMRGIYEEIPDGTEPGTYIAGVYDSAASMVTELVNAPNPIDFRIIVEGEKIDIGRMNVLYNKRILDMKNGFITRKTLFSDTKNRKFLYESLRFLSSQNPHIGVMQIYITALDKQAKIIVQDTIDDSVTNIGSLLEGRKRHTQLVEVSTSKDMNYLCVKTFTKKIWIAYASFLAISRGMGQGIGTLNKIFNMALKKSEPVCFTKIFCINTSKHIGHKDLKRNASKELRKAVRTGFEKLLGDHITVWHKKWQKADIRIEGDKEAQKALRFNIYHLLIAGKERDENVSIGARTLSGNGYGGHIFWDTEIFILPFFIYNFPRIARNLLLYRYHRLNAARRIAAQKGYKGVLFPWESADDGVESTPPYAKNLDGSIIEIRTMDYEHHIVSDIAFGVYHYFTATDDVRFMLQAGLEIIFETARFWASRVTYNSKRDIYEIKNAMGPDEFHEIVNNSAYVNKMAQWNLFKAADLYKVFCKNKKRLFRKIQKKLIISEKEIEDWRHIAKKIKIPYSSSKGILEEFEGYFKKKDVALAKFDDFFMPVLPHEVSIRDIGKTQIVKQADVTMLLYLLSHEFSEEEKRKNYLYYVTRTLHKSSLSPSIHSIVASEIKDTARGYAFFLFSLYGDLKNMFGNTAEGMHAASLGGTWQAVVMGFAGFRISKGLPSVEPRLPEHLKSIDFSLKWKGSEIKVKAGRKKIKLFVSGKKKGYILVKCFGSVHKVPFNAEYVAHS